MTSLMLLLTCTFALAGCTTGSNNSSADLASVLSVSDVEKSGGQTPDPAKPKAKSVVSKPNPTETKTALASTSKKKTASAKAASAAVTQRQDSRKPNDTKVAAIAPNKKTRKKGLSALFGTNERTSSRVNKRNVKKTTAVRTRASLNKRSRVKRPRNRSDTGDLPGVKLKRLFGILGNSEKNYDLDEPVEVASIASRARRGNFGLLLQTKNVQVGCFPRRLVKILKQVERRYRRTPIVTSGYRSKAKNRRVRGARNSAHITCKAADIQVKGVSKWQLAKYLRSVPGRGGVGTYCHTNSVHIDIGIKRDWNWRCRRGRRR